MESVVISEYLSEIGSWMGSLTAPVGSHRFSNRAPAKLVLVNQISGRCRANVVDDKSVCRIDAGTKISFDLFTRKMCLKAPLRVHYRKCTHAMEPPEELVINEGFHAVQT
jgi:hypothetical protein